MIISKLDDLKLIELQTVTDDRGDMYILQKNLSLKLDFVRTFIVKGKKGVVRGHHSHKKCSQLLIALNGSLEVVCKDGSKEVTFCMDSPNKGLLSPPGIWSHQRFLVDNTILGVWCDRPYEEEDYIRDWDEYSNSLTSH